MLRYAFPHFPNVDVWTWSGRTQGDASSTRAGKIYRVQSNGHRARNRRVFSHTLRHNGLT